MLGLCAGCWSQNYYVLIKILTYVRQERLQQDNPTVKDSCKSKKKSKLFSKINF